MAGDGVGAAAQATRQTRRSSSRRWGRITAGREKEERRRGVEGLVEELVEGLVEELVEGLVEGMVDDSFDSFDSSSFTSKPSPPLTLPIIATPASNTPSSARSPAYPSSPLAAPTCHKYPPFSSTDAPSSNRASETPSNATTDN